MIKVDTPTNIKHLTLCFTREVIEQYCKFQEVDVLHITANVDSHITKFFDPEAVELKGFFDSNEIEFGSPVPRAFEVDEDNPYLTAIDGVLFSKDKKTIIAFPKRDEDYEYSIPEGVTCIGHEAFFDQRHLTSIHIPDSVKIIEDRAFLNCFALKELILPRSLEEFCPSFGISHTLKMERLKISEDNEAYTTIDGVLFSKDMKSLIFYPPKKKNDFYQIPEGVEHICSEAFKLVGKLQFIKFPSTLKSIDSHAIFICGRLNDFDGIPNELLVRMSLTKKDAKRLNMSRIKSADCFYGCGIHKKLYAMKEQIRKSFQDKQ